MPIRIDDDLPVKKTLEDENIFVMGTGRAHSQDIRPLDILIPVSYTHLTLPTTERV